MRIMLANLTKMVDDSGGLAKVTSNFANEMKKRGHDVTVVYSDVKVGVFHYPIREDIPTIDIRHFKGEIISYPWYLKLKREWYRTFNKQKARTVNNDFAEDKLLKNLETTLEEVCPEVIVSFQPAASKLLLCDLNINIPVITMSHGDPEDYFHIYPKKEIPALIKSSVNQVLLPSFAEHIMNHLSEAKTIVIGNAVPQYEEQADLRKEKDIYTIIFVGRLVKNHKRPQLLIEAFQKIAYKYPNWRVELWGSKDSKVFYKQLELYIAEHGLKNQVFLRGVTSDVDKKLVEADILAIPSAYEGFPLGMTEAMSMGLPAIGFKECSAVNELIIDGENGFLAEATTENFVDKLERLMENQSLRAEMGDRARSSMKAYSPQIIWQKWEDLLQRTIENNKISDSK